MLSSLRARKSLIRAVLGQWSVFLLLAFLQPCCEALAAAIPHEHEYAVPGGHHDGGDDHHHHHEDASESPGGHEHCPSLVDHHAEMPMVTAVSATDTKAPPPALLPTPVTTLHPLRYAGSTAASGFRVPESLPRLYLNTLRLRI